MRAHDVKDLASAPSEQALEMQNPFRKIALRRLPGGKQSWTETSCK